MGYYEKGPTIMAMSPTSAFDIMGNNKIYSS